MTTSEAAAPATERPAWFSFAGRWTDLFLTSGLGLFFEIAAIRWLSSELRLFSYFKNLPLLAAFLGLGLGFSIIGRGRDLKPAFGPLLAVFVGVVLAVSLTAAKMPIIYPTRGEDHLFYTADLSYWVSLIVFLAMVLIFFLLTMFLFIPLGQATGEEMARFSPLPAYTVNILASLAGVWAFSLISYVQAPPVVWFGLGVAGWLIYLYRRRRLDRLTSLCGAGAVGAILLLGQGVIWSPYQRLEVHDMFLPDKDGTPVQVGYELNIQQAFFQRALDLSNETVASLGPHLPLLVEVADTYDLPYRWLPPNSTVLVVGAGMGNDVAAALRGGAAAVTAVEIDPAIADLGRELHPEHPYQSERVTLWVDDARSFFQKTGQRYAVITFGLLDSQTLLSGLSSVRLDSFVYTLESFEQVKTHLEPDGMVALTFAHSTPWIEQRMGRMLAQVFGQNNVYWYTSPAGFTYLAGAVPPGAASELLAWQPDPLYADVPMTTDDWPYLYLRDRRIPAAYWQALALVAAACLFIIRRSFPEAGRPQWHFVWLGGAFLLVEFKSITELALLYGSTWIVNSLAISGVLLMILAANVVLLRIKRAPLGLAYALLFASLALTYFVPIGRLLGGNEVLKAGVSTLFLSLPIFFAGLIFGEALRQSGEIGSPFASNLAGSVSGGVLEYGSLMFGIRSLYLLAAAVYVAAAVAWPRGGRK